MPCFKDDDLVQYAEHHASADLARQIETHLTVDLCRQCGGFVAWLFDALPRLRDAFHVTPSALIERTLPRVLTHRAPGPIQFETALEVHATPAGVRNLAAEMERVYQLGEHRLELLMQACLQAPFIDLVGLLEPTPAGAVDVLLIADQVPIDSQCPDADGRFSFARLSRGVYEIEVQIEGQPARRTPPFEVRMDG